MMARDPRLQQIAWRDLAELSILEVVTELSLSLPWLLVSLYLASYQDFLLALPFSFMFFLTGLRQVHNAYHFALGISRSLTEWILLLLSVMMLGSMHAIKFNHLEHHKHCLNDHDVEGRCARLTMIQAIFYGPLFPLRMHWNAIQNSNQSYRSWIGLELSCNFIWVVLVFGIFNIFALKYHVIVMAIGQCLTSFFAVWTVHHDCEQSSFGSRTIRGFWRSMMTYNMFYHTEHHLFPKVPTCNLHKLAERIDQKIPELSNHKVM